jgi:Ran GTPase-activating protein (RanGAP) involved in mRNA processing and transport
MTDLDTLFADLRGLMQRDRLDAAARRGVWRILHRAWRTDPRAHAEQLVPYAAGFPHHFTRALVTAHAPEHLEIARRVAPFATFGLRVDFDALRDLDPADTTDVTRLEAVNLDADKIALLDGPGRFPNLRELALPTFLMTDHELAEFIRDLPFDALTHLDLSSNPLDPAAATALLEAARLDHLTHLNLSRCHLRDASFEALTLNPAFSRLARLDAANSGLTNAAAVALAHSPHLARLRHLDLSHSFVATKGARALASSPNVAHLLHLDLSDCELHDMGTVALARSPHLGALQELRLSYNGVEDDSLTALSRPTCALTSLTRLDLSTNLFSADALAAFARSPLFARLTHLDLSDHHLDDLDAPARRRASVEAARALFHGDTPLALTHLALRENDLAHAAIALIASSPNLGRLRRLDLADNTLTVKGARALVDGSNLGALRELSLAGCTLANNTIDALARGGALSDLTHLDLTRVGLDPSRARALLGPDPFPSLVDLDLTEANLTRALADSLSNLLPALERLVLDGCGFERGEVAALLRGDHPPRLRELSLRDTTLDEADVRAVFTAPRLRRVRLTADAPAGADAIILDHLSDLLDLIHLDSPWNELDPADPRLAFVLLDTD